MHQVTVKRDELIERLRKNRDGHRAEYEKAMAGYRKRVVEWFEEQRERVLRGESQFAVTCPHPRPEDHTADYETALEMLQMSVDETVPITGEEFRQYVGDDWGWSRLTKETAALYMG